jgi:hypothetical protein
VFLGQFIDVFSKKFKGPTGTLSANHFLPSQFIGMSEAKRKLGFQDVQADR